ncbi:MAG: ketoacyl-ACP synthase III [Dysgonomonas sp.]|nr:ketoacyl-ACP synthase III [Dysgonomonas sp.]
MYLNATGYYIPQGRVDNKYFTTITGLEEDWFVKRTGMRTRSRASDEETIDYMSLQAVNEALVDLPYDYEEIDLIIFASYTPSDTIGTTGHIIQREFGMEKAKVFYLSSACSSSVNAMEIIQSFFKTGVSKKALMICAERNSSYSDDKDCQSGHLWGDAAVAFFFSSESFSSKEAMLIDITSQGLGHIGSGPVAVSMNPTENGLQMPLGKEVFVHACNYISQSTKNIVKRNGYSVDDLRYFIGHQANMRILSRVGTELGVPSDKTLSNLEKYGNTGCASAPLVFAENYDKYETGDLICLSIFGGGYSVGSCLFLIN